MENGNVAPEDASANESKELTPDELRACHMFLESRWAKPNISWPTTYKLLNNTRLGTFILTTSTRPPRKFLLRVKTVFGIRSIFIYYRNKHFEVDTLPKLPIKFKCIIKLINYLKEICTTDNEGTPKLLNQAGQVIDDVNLRRPHRFRFPTLLHLSRLAVNKLEVDGVQPYEEFLPTPIKNYLKDYPYTF